MARTKARRPKTPQAPITRQHARPKRPLWLYAFAAAAVIAAGSAYLAFNRGSGTQAAAGTGLPNTSDYHSLLVSTSDPNRILLGTHQVSSARPTAACIGRATGWRVRTR